MTVPTPEQVNTLIEDLLHRGVHVRSTAVFNAVLANLIRNKRGKEAKEYFDVLIKPFLRWRSVLRKTIIRSLEVIKSCVRVCSRVNVRILVRV